MRDDEEDWEVIESAVPVDVAERDIGKDLVEGKP